jgi:hypothetical protein
VTMPERFEESIYGLETVKLMNGAFDEAWLKVKSREDAEVVRKLLASTIVAAALAALSIPKSWSGFDAAAPMAAMAWPEIPLDFILPRSRGEFDNLGFPRN